MEILGTAGSPFIRLSRPLVYCSPHSSIKPWMTCSIHQSRRWSNVQPDALADILEHSASLAVGVRIHDASLVKFTQSTGVHLQLPLQLRDCRRRLLIALLKRGFHTLCLLPVNVGVIHRRQTQILVNVLCAIIWQANIIGKSLTTMLHSPAWQFSTSGYVQLPTSSWTNQTKWNKFITTLRQLYNVRIFSMPVTKIIQMLLLCNGQFTLPMQMQYNYSVLLHCAIWTRSVTVCKNLDKSEQ